MSRILLDRSVDSLGTTTAPATQLQSVKWGESEVRAKILGWRRRPRRGSEHEWLGRQIGCLPTIARLAREGRIQFLTYSELHMEAWSAREFGMRNTKGDIFSKINIDEVDPAVERSYFFSLSIDQCTSREDVRKFCIFLMDCDASELEAIPHLWSRFPDWMKNNLRQLDRFKAICQALPRKHYPDALHLWTAEVNECDYFLTVDRKFIRGLTESSRLPLKTIPITPEDLLINFGISERDPLPVEDDEFHYLFE